MPLTNAIQIRQIQQALAHKGFDPGIIDGVWGRRTEGAVRAFQQSRGLVVDGIVGKNTRFALLGSLSTQAIADDPALVWFQEARRLIGLKEGYGEADNPEILDWADDLDIAYPQDSIPWCGLFVAHCIGSTLSREALPTNPLGARKWLGFGAPCDPQLGAVLVFWRGSKNGWKGHVGFYAGETPDGNYHVLGGNQSDKVNIALIKGNRLLGARWPATVPVADGSAHILSNGVSIFSTNEQ